MQLRHESRIAWCCAHQMYLQADLSYEVTQERGYSVARLQSVGFLKPPRLVRIRSIARKFRENVIPFLEPKHRTLIPPEQRDLQDVFARIARQQEPLGSIKSQHRNSRNKPRPGETAQSLGAVFEALSRERMRRVSE